jgi:hypothetical protein
MPRAVRIASLTATLFALGAPSAGCATGGHDGGRDGDGGGGSDAGRSIEGGTADGGASDGGPGSDGGPAIDSGTIDSGGSDSGGSDSGGSDSGGVDSGDVDSGGIAEDAGPADAGHDAPPAIDAGCPGTLLRCGGDCVDTRTNTAHCGGCGAPCAGGESCSAGTCATPAGWFTTAEALECVFGSRHAYACSAGGSPGAVWGTDLYTDDSSICTAATHAGRITLAGGGLVTIEMAAGASSYTGSTRNGITSLDYGLAWPCSYVFP